MKANKTAVLLMTAGASAAIALAAPAHASTDEYLSHVQSEVPFVVSQYGSQQVLALGYSVCNWEAQGVTGASDLADLMIAQMPMSRTAAVKIQVYAEQFIGC
ncbi:hypothetical protein TUM20983_20360 [Mycobacterium antarcticum]|uniref:hypothetical protein n=1 Tax=Mycolicibacterium sp. TUM20983 TaxID=3023369 RepID=UPI00239A09D5|nr:hypothetical protein [Mycolicibacterium sp. TUM20983]GLP74926.1 hypothetical protein TUM20983_20360 [Mycolicibacterium sp. TUM20983]